VALPSAEFEIIAARFWPGPITLVVPARDSLSGRITADTGTVGIRWPDADYPLRLLAACHHPLTATSANRSGEPIVRTVDDAIDDFGERLDAAVDAGPLTTEATSTVLDLTSDPPEVLRDGPVLYNDLAIFLGGRLRRRSA
jgi:L-threonylcarbamoyladenylate synthase